VKNTIAKGIPWAKKQKKICKQSWFWYTLTDERRKETMDAYGKSMVRMIVGNLHVGTPDREIIRNFYDRVKADKDWDREARHNLYRFALTSHNDNRREYRDVMSGRLYTA